VAAERHAQPPRRGPRALADATVAALEQAQRAGVNLTAAYLGAFIGSETGQRAREIPRIDAMTGSIGLAEDGQPLDVPLSKTLIGVKAR
jgi:hypothetical protein